MSRRQEQPDLPEPPPPGPLRRRGPRPLLLHLGLAAAMNTPNSRAFSAVWPSSKPASAGMGKDQAGKDNAGKDGAGKDGAGKDGAATAEAPPPPPVALHDPVLVAGIAAYRRHPYQRQVPSMPVLWREGASTLLDYGQVDDGRVDQGGGTADRPAVLFVPSLINRAYVLDLMEEHSMLRRLAAGGVRPLLLDWGWPGALERRLTLTDLIAGRLERAMMAVGTPMVLAGYCMGGLMALAAALRRPDLVRRLVLLATPWDFHAGGGAAAQRLAALLPLLEPVLGVGETLPVDVLQAGFALLDPGSVAAKYRDFAAQPQDTLRARRFVAIEDWLNDGVPLAAAAARETIGQWYRDNLPGQGQWLVAGLPVRPQDLAIPCLVAMAQRDRLVPPASASALLGLLPNAQAMRADCGHVGLVAGAQAEDVLWQPMLDWLLR